MKQEPSIEVMTSRPFYRNFSDASPKGLLYLCLLGGLMLITYAAATLNGAFLVVAAFLPLLFLLLIGIVRNPIWSYVLAAIIFCYFHAIYRYANVPGLSGILDIVLFLCLFILLVNTAYDHSAIPWMNAVNALTVTYAIWMLYCLFSLLSPYTEFHNPLTSRGIFVSVPLTYLLSSILMCTTKRLKVTLFLLGLFIITIAIKAAIQKYRWFDAAETRYLQETNSWTTHLLPTGIRYFSFYSDAGSFGPGMAMFTLIFCLLVAIAKRFQAKIFCLIIAALACFGMFLSGTRGAMIVPFGGLLLYTLISRNLKLMLASIFAGSLAFVFFYFTDLGEGNSYIRRMRTAFRPMEDASFNVRLDNQKAMAYYLRNKPIGIGVGGYLRDEQNLVGDNQRVLPPDSYYVDVWVQNGIVGLCLYIGILAFILIHSCYLLMFRIKNDQLRLILAALLCGVFGMWLSGYVGRGMGTQPNQFLIAMFLAFVLNGPYMDKQLRKDEILI